jgi:hypothetical protein
VACRHSKFWRGRKRDDLGLGECYLTRELMLERGLQVCKSCASDACADLSVQCCCNCGRLCALIARESKHSEVQGCAAKGMSAGETAYVVTQRQPGLEELPSAIARNRPRIYGHECPPCLEFIFAHSTVIASFTHRLHVKRASGKELPGCSALTPRSSATSWHPCLHAYTANQHSSDRH